MSYTTEEKLFEASNVSIAYGSKKIIENINFSILNTKRSGVNQGQSIAVVGRSGRGKSTLFKAITGLVTPTTGLIEVSDMKGGFRPIKEGEVGFVQQKYPLSRNQTVNSMLLQAAAQGKIPESERQKIVNAKLAEWGLEPQKFHTTKQLSGGQSQRVAILEQMLCSHYFIVLDEPFSGLDVKNKVDVRESFHRILNSHELNTIIFSTHEIELAVELADTVLVLGYPMEANGLKTVGTILETFDLKQMNLAWQPFSQSHIDLQKRIESIISAS